MCVGQVIKIRTVTHLFLRNLRKPWVGMTFRLVSVGSQLWVGKIPLTGGHFYGSQKRALNATSGQQL